ncbi:MAG TPA: DHH family phosphoesterase, partial [Planctomycetota bacterium]|nr:DHH family phosphoesterase [Planctomycetota bacterium]
MSDSAPLKPISAAPLPVFGHGPDNAIAASIRERVDRAQHIVITGHERPDGDCLGSEIALCAVLRQLGKHAEIINSDPVPRRLEFLLESPAERVPLRTLVPGDKFDSDLLFVLDATDLRRLGNVQLEQFANAAVIDIDHHLGNPNFGAINWVDSRCAATGELIFLLAAYNGWPVPFTALQALYVALLTDTGQFAYSNTSPRVMRMAAELLERGVDSETVWQKVYLNKTLPELALEARARTSLLCSAGGRICSIALSAEDFAATGTGPHNAEEFSQIPRSLTGVDLSLFFYEING